MPKKAVSYSGYVGERKRYRKQLPKELINEATPALEDAVRFRAGQGRSRADRMTDPTDWGQFLMEYAKRKKRGNRKVMGNR